MSRARLLHSLLPSSQFPSQPRAPSDLKSEIVTEFSKYEGKSVPPFSTVLHREKVESDKFVRVAYEIHPDPERGRRVPGGEESSAGR